MMVDIHPDRRRSDALTFRLDALATYIERHGAGTHPLDLAMAIAWSAVEEIDNLHAELIERCETMERMAREPLWLTVSSGNPMIHFVSDPQWIWSGITEPPPQLTCIRCGQTFPEHELSAHLATCE